MAWRYLKGIVDEDVCLVLDMDKALLQQSVGMYADFSTEGRIGRCLKKEYCTTAYSSKTAKLLKVLKPDEFATKDEIMAIQMLRKLNLQWL